MVLILSSILRLILPYFLRYTCLYVVSDNVVLFIVLFSLSSFNLLYISKPVNELGFVFKDNSFLWLSYDVWHVRVFAGAEQLIQW